MRKIAIILIGASLVFGSCKIFRKKKDCLGCPKWSAVQQDKKNV